MLLKSELSRIGEKFMFVVFENNCYSVGNLGSRNGNYLLLEEQKFPLQKSTSLKELDKRYFKKAKKEIEEFKEDYAKEQKIDIRLIVKEIEKNDFLSFYLFNIQKYYADDVDRKFGIEKQTECINRDTKGEGSITIDLLAKDSGNVAMINKRIFPLKQIQEKFDPCIFIDSRIYGFVESQITLEEFERNFQATLESKLKEEVIKEISYLKEQEREISSIEKNLSSILTNCRKNKFSYEYGNIGFDVTNNYIYWLPSTKDKKCNETNAIGTPLSKIGNKVVISSPVSRNKIERKNKDEPFTVKSGACIVDINQPNSNDIKEVINYLRDCTNTIF